MLCVFAAIARSAKALNIFNHILSAKPEGYYVVPRKFYFRFFPSTTEAGISIKLFQRFPFLLCEIAAYAVFPGASLSEILTYLIWISSAPLTSLIEHLLWIRGLVSTTACAYFFRVGGSIIAITLAYLLAVNNSIFTL